MHDQPHVAGVARNTLWNLSGLALPMVVAIATIPLLVDGLGPERFGFLAIAWVIVGYFGLFDFGLGQAVTRSLAGIISRGEMSKAPQLVWNAVVAHGLLGVAGAAVLALLGPWLAKSALRLPWELRQEGVTAFMLLAASVPFVVLSAAFRGVLEACGRFDLVNSVRIPVSVINYVAPLVVLLFTPHLGAVVSVIALGRAIGCGAQWYLVLRYSMIPRGPWHPALSAIRPMFRFGGWLTVTNILSPVIVSIDRFIIGAAMSIGAVTFYAAPYEVITKLWIFSGALMGVLFPVFSALGEKRGHLLPEVVNRAAIVLTAATLPFVIVALAFAHELLNLWLGPQVALKSGDVARWLAVGVFASVLAQVPLTVLHGLGRADVTAKLLFAELIGYVMLAWFLANHFGIEGVAAAWTTRAITDGAVLYGLMIRLCPRPVGGHTFRLPPGKAATSLGFIVVFLGIGVLLDGWSTLKVATFLITLALFCYWLWAFLLNEADRAAVRRALHTPHDRAARQAERVRGPDAHLKSGDE